ncbi:hypothetical protein PPYR_13209 [Photinus pyralis]|uniref:Adenosine kinase n=1 Tax=Photinus pyralis TaxID=7054 RepID=A0A5N4A8G9_PHOPY|nr:adenosine kinase-like [Photinus pyralis]KAB0793589.1 hypothetical protein PPYR_13209 [Photinus pyralis]
MSAGGFVTLGSPLIDIIAEVDKTFLDSFGLKENDAISLSGCRGEIFERVEELKPKRLIGGCSINTARALQWVLKRPNFCTVVGTVGDDDYGNAISAQLHAETIRPILQRVPDDRTGRCVVLLNATNRSLCTELGASKRFDLEDLMKRDVWAAVREASYYYIPGFFLCVSRECVLTVAKYSAGHAKTFAFNISAPFIANLYRDDILELLPHVDILFGNEAEIRALADVLGYTGSNLGDILLQVNKLTKGIVVVTRGSGSVFTVDGLNVSEHLVEKLEEGRVKDTSAAGDCFVGGFLAGFILKRPISECVASGSDVARNVIQSNGCWFVPNFRIN